MSSASFKKILIVNPFGIGDAIFSMYLVEALKKEFPQATIGFMGNERTMALLRMNRSIDVCHEFNRDELRALRRARLSGFFAKAFEKAREVKKERYDTLFDLSLGREFSFVAFCLGIPRRIGFDFKRRGRWLTHKNKLEAYEKKHVADWQLDLLRLLNIEPPRVDARLPLTVSGRAEKAAQEVLARNGLGAQTAFVAIAPGGGKSWGTDATYKQWAPERFSQAVERYAQGKDAAALILGDAEEKKLLEGVGRGLSVPHAVVAGESLELVSALLRRSRFLLANDGGLLHLANALGVRSVAIYGPVDEKVYGPYGAGQAWEVLTQAVPCRPCYQKFHFPPCPHRRRCLDELSVEKVLAAVQKIV